MSIGDTTLRTLSLNDKFTEINGVIYITGVQALVKLPLLQRELDVAAGLDTAGFISGYRGSPLGTYDQQLWKAASFLEGANVRFVPGVNEELAATAVWGTQQLAFEPGSRHDGVFAIWYGKSPGVDRAMDALRHGNAAGASAHGGVLVLAGDDHPGRSASVPNQSELALVSAGIPVLNPASIDDYLSLGLHGIAMSRFSGCWVGMIVLAETVDGASTIPVDLDALRPTVPGGDAATRQIRWPDPHTKAEARLHEDKLPAVLAYARANKLNRVVLGGDDARLGIVSTGKAYTDVRQALSNLGIDEAAARQLRLRVMKVDLIWPLEPESARSFAHGLEEIIVVEEKRPTVEPQLKDILFHQPARPRVLGKTDGLSIWDTPPDQLLFPVKGELSPRIIAAAVARRLLALGVPTEFQTKLSSALAANDAAEALAVERARKPAGDPAAILTLGSRAPAYCSGCPHNTSTKVPDGSRAIAGIGCHFMAQWIYPETTATFSQMGGEGATWVGQANFTDTKHVFVNLGDGTFYHSGLLAIRQAISSGVNLTYKILYNQAVAMTGGQPVDGNMPVANMAEVLLAEGVRKVVVVTDDLSRYDAGLPRGVEAHDRADLDHLQRQLRDLQGCTAIIYDQTCAAEKRRLRKAGKYPDPARHVVINPEVCEGCGDCNRTSNCLSVVPLETPLGRKRAIDQSSCNKDFSCLNGFCPSFVTVEGGKRRKNRGRKIDPAALAPEPARIDLGIGSVDILIAGLGGSGVVTVGALVGMAAHLENLAVSVLDMTGLAQKGGAVFSHVRIARSRDSLQASRIRSADLVLGCDVATIVEPEALAALDPARTRVITTVAEAPTGQFARAPDLPRIKPSALREVEARVGKDRVQTIDAARAAAELLGDTIQANVLLLGFAWQQGTIPLSREALRRAIELNGIAVATTLDAFEWGRILAVDLDRAYADVQPIEIDASETLAGILADRSKRLTGYQGSALAKRYTALVTAVGSAEENVMPGSRELATLAARYYYKMLAIKDEYEVSRLHASADFAARIAAEFEGDYKLHFHLAPPALERKGPHANTRKRQFGPWIMTVFRVLAGLRFFRNSVLDPFRRTRERRFEVASLAEYEDHARRVSERLTVSTFDASRVLLSYPERVRGFGHVRAASAERVRPEIELALATLANGSRSQQQADAPSPKAAA